MPPLTIFANPAHLDAATLPAVRRGTKSPVVLIVVEAAQGGYDKRTVAYTKADAVKMLSRMVDGSYVYRSQLGLMLPGFWVKTAGRLVRQNTEPVLENPSRARRSGARMRSNPARGAMLSTRVIELRYRHAGDGQLYRHPFKAGVCAELLPDGSVRLYGAKGQRLWGDF